MPLSIAELYEGVLKDLRIAHLEGNDAYTEVKAARGDTLTALDHIRRAADLLADEALKHAKVDTIIGKLGDIAELLRKAKA